MECLVRKAKTLAQGGTSTRVVGPLVLCVTLRSPPDAWMRRQASVFPSLGLSEIPVAIEAARPPVCRSFASTCLHQRPGSRGIPGLEENKVALLYLEKQHGLCQDDLLKLINGLLLATRESRGCGVEISRTLPVKFSSTIHGGTEKKKRPNWALFLFFIFATPRLRRRDLASRALKRGCGTRACACRFRSCRRCCRKAALAIRSRCSAWRSSTPCPTTCRP